MVEPRDFGFNSDTALDNTFQHHPDSDDKTTRTQALREFWRMVEQLDSKAVEVITLDSPQTIETPDAVFPNNWFSTTSDSLLIYPMFAASRRREVQQDNLVKVLVERGYIIKHVNDLRDKSHLNGVLEGTGALVFDHSSDRVFANISERCDASAFDSFCERFNYHGVPIRAVTDGIVPVYHTNVLMAIGPEYGVIAQECLTSDAINDAAFAMLRDTKADIVTISEEQMVESFCGNVLQLCSAKGYPLLVMSESARKGFTTEQMKVLEKHSDILACDIETIEYVGGGSARCMLAEIFLQKH